MKKLIIFVLFTKFIFSWENNIDRIDFYYQENFDTKIRVIRINEKDGVYTFVNDDTIKSKYKNQSIKIELYKPLLKVENHKISIGYGVKIQDLVEFNSEYTNLTYLIPMYLSTLYEYNKKPYDIFGKFNIGYGLAVNNKDVLENFDGYSSAKIRGGLNFSLESGIVYKNFILSLAYDQSSTKLLITQGENQSNATVDIDYSIVSIGLGYKFDRFK